MITRPITRSIARPLTRGITEGIGPWLPLRLFRNGEQGLWYDLRDFSTLYQDSAGTTPVTGVEQPVGLVLDKSGNGNNASQTTSTARPTAVAGGIRHDLVDDRLLTSASNIQQATSYINTPHGWYKTGVQQIAGKAFQLPRQAMSSMAVREGTLTEAQEAALAEHFGTERKFFVGQTTDSTVSVRTEGGDAANRGTTFIGANGAVYTVPGGNATHDLIAQGLTSPFTVVWGSELINNTALTNFHCNNNQLTGSIPSMSANTALLLIHCQINQLTGAIPALSANTALSEFYCNNNQLTGSIPSLSANTALTRFYCQSNQLTGSIPSLSANTALTRFHCSSNQLTGAIPSLSANTALVEFYCNNNQLTGWGGGTVSATLGDFQAQNNQLPQAAVDAILAAFVAAGRNSGTRILNLGGTGNATPSAAGLTDKDTLQSRGWTVTTN